MQARLPAAGIRIVGQPGRAADELTQHEDVPAPRHTISGDGAARGKRSQLAARNRLRTGRPTTSPYAPQPQNALRGQPGGRERIRAVSPIAAAAPRSRRILCAGEEWPG